MAHLLAVVHLDHAQIDPRAIVGRHATIAGARLVTDSEKSAGATDEHRSDRPIAPPARRGQVVRDSTRVDLLETARPDLATLPSAGLLGQHAVMPAVAAPAARVATGHADRQLAPVAAHFAKERPPAAH